MQVRRRYADRVYALGTREIPRYVKRHFCGSKSGRKSGFTPLGMTVASGYCRSRGGVTAHTENGPLERQIVTGDGMNSPSGAFKGEARVNQRHRPPNA